MAYRKQDGNLWSACIHIKAEKVSLLSFYLISELKKVRVVSILQQAALPP